MIGRLFLHIGPPKSATTALQVALERLGHDGFRYEGVFQTRSRNAGSLAQRLHAAILDGGAAPDGLRDWLAQGGVAVISEEMLALQQGGLTTADKIRRLGSLLSDIPTTVLVALRDPVEALPSLYQELRRGLPLPLQLDFARFCTDGRTDCYDYSLLSRTLAEAGLTELRWLDFRALAENRLTTADLFGAFDLWRAKPLQLDRLNVGGRSASDQGRKLERTSLRAIGRTHVVRAALDWLGLRGTRLTKWGAVLADRVTLGRAGVRRLDVPPDRAAQLGAGYRTMLAQMAAQRSFAGRGD